MLGEDITSSSRRRYAAFTLVELLVVIGIIALLISILLPSLNAARRSSVQLKCAAQLKNYYNAVLIYASENKNAWPPARIRLGSTFVNPSKVYSVSGIDFPTDTSGSTQSKSIYFYDFLAKYLTKTKTGYGSTSAEESAEFRRSVIWACPAWEGYAATQPGGVNRNQVGIGMNMWPTFTADYPAIGANPPHGMPSTDYSQSVFIDALGDAGQKGIWVNSTKWGKRGAERGLFMDCLFYDAESRAAPIDGTFPPQPAIQNNNTFTPGIQGQTTVDCYRHGKSPGPGAVADSLSARGGKVAYNVMYADGHVNSETEMKTAYLALRQRYPG